MRLAALCDFPQCWCLLPPYISSFVKATNEKKRGFFFHVDVNISKC